MVYDCFMFFNEIELLKVRLEYLYDVVDYFVITECNITQSGEKKPLYFKENRNQFEKWSKKIIYNLVDDVPEDFSKRTQDPITNKILDICANYSHYPHSTWRYDNETYQKECILRKLKEIGCFDSDVIWFSDLDEIPNKRLLSELVIPENSYLNFKQYMHQYYINVLKEEDWFGTRAFRWDLVKNLNVGLNGMRMSGRGENTKKWSGWHFTFLGGPEAIKRKIKAYGHQEFNNDYILNNIEDNVKNNRDIFFRPGSVYRDTNFDTIPMELLDLFKTYYPESIKVKL